MAVPMQCAWDLASKDLAGVFWRQHSQLAVRIDPFHPEGTEAVRESELVREGGRESAESGGRETRNLACTHARACITRPRRHRSLRACASSPSSPLDSMPTFARSLAATIARSLAATIAHTGRSVAGLARRKGACARAHLPTPPRRSSPRDPGRKKRVAGDHYHMATGGRGQGRAMAPRLAAAALLCVCALDVAGAAQGLPSGLTVRQAAAAVAVPWAGGRLPQVLPLRRHGSRQLYLRGAGEDGDEEAEEEGGADVGEEGGSGQEEEAMDSDAGPMTLVKAIKEVLYYARIHHGVAKGIKEVVQALERGEAQLVVLAEVG